MRYKWTTNSIHGKNWSVLYSYNIHQMKNNTSSNCLPIVEKILYYGNCAGGNQFLWLTDDNLQSMFTWNEGLVLMVVCIVIYNTEYYDTLW